MQDVSLLVDVMYGYQKEHDAAEELQRKIEDERDEQDNGLPGEQPPVEQKKSEAPAAGAGAANEAEEDEEEKDPNALNLDLTLIVPALQRFHKKRDEEAITKGMQNMGKQKKKDSKF